MQSSESNWEDKIFGGSYRQKFLLPELSAWQRRPLSQIPAYQDRDRLRDICHRLKHSQPLVSQAEILLLRDYLASAAEGQRFILQAGDCAERFQDCDRERVERKLRLFQKLASVLEPRVNRPVIVVGRIAGQYFKPRSSDFEMTPNGRVPSFRGDGVNSFDPTILSRQPDPDRLWLAYVMSKQTHEFSQKSSHAYNPQFVSHEGLNLYYEESLSRYNKEAGQWFCQSAHFLWIGDRTRQRDGAHVEFFSKVVNPIGLKIGPTMTPLEIRDLCRILNPQRIPGRINLITRLGANNVAKLLPHFIEAAQASRSPVTWIVDPMHGNTRVTKSGVKTRQFDDIKNEVIETFAVHRSAHSTLSGLHIELTSDDVTECVGGVSGVVEDDLSKRYETFCDPRLNPSQAIELCSLIDN